MPEPKPARQKNRREVDVGQSLAQLHDLLPLHPSSFRSSLINRCERLLVTPLRDFGPRDLRVMLGQQFYPETLVPLALPLLEEDPLLDAEYYPGDLLWSTLHQKAEFWQTAPELLTRTRTVVKRALLLTEDTHLERLLWEEIEDFKARTVPPSR